MSQKTKEELALDRLLNTAATPPLVSADLAERILARARLTPQQHKSTAAPYAAGMALAASLALGIWLGAAGIVLPGFSQTVTWEELNAEDLTGLSDAETLVEGETL